MRTLSTMTATPALAIGLALLAGPTTAQDAVPLKDAKLNIEYNATDKDAGFQGFVDSEGWQRLVVSGPDGEVLKFEGLGELAGHGLTELFFETVEPADTDMPLDKVLALLPEGSYAFEGVGMEMGESTGATSGVASFTHTIPAGPELVTPGADAVVPAGELAVSWNPVTKTIDGKAVDIIAYQLIIEKDQPPHPDMIGKMGLSMYVSPSVTRIEIPEGFLESGTPYLWEVLAIEVSGNQTLSSSAFRTE